MNAAPLAGLLFVAARMARGGDAFVDLSLARIPTSTGVRTAGTLGVAVG